MGTYVVLKNLIVFSSINTVEFHPRRTMPTSLIVIDDFLPEPHTVRKSALELEYPELDAATPYAGLNSGRRVRIPGLDEEISRIVGERVVSTPESFHAVCRIAFAGSAGRNEVHVDPGQWSGILYLSLPEHCIGGTEFYRHIPSNSERVPMTHAEQQAMGVRSFQDVLEKVIRPDGNDPTKWERIMQVPMRFNRLVMFRPWLWHNAGPGFGDKLENARLVYLLFFDAVRSDPRPT